MQAIRFLCLMLSSFFSIISFFLLGNTAVASEGVEFYTVKEGDIFTRIVESHVLYMRSKGDYFRYKDALKVHRAVNRHLFKSFDHIKPGDQVILLNSSQLETVTEKPISTGVSAKPVPVEVSTTQPAQREGLGKSESLKSETTQSAEAPTAQNSPNSQEVRKETLNQIIKSARTQLPQQKKKRYFLHHKEKTENQKTLPTVSFYNDNETPQEDATTQRDPSSIALSTGHSKSSAKSSAKSPAKSSALPFTIGVDHFVYTTQLNSNDLVNGGNGTFFSPLSLSIRPRISVTLTDSFGLFASYEMERHSFGSVDGRTILSQKILLHSVQLGLKYRPFRKLILKLAYRYAPELVLDASSTDMLRFNEEYLQRMAVSAHYLMHSFNKYRLSLSIGTEYLFGNSNSSPEINPGYSIGVYPGLSYDWTSNLTLHLKPFFEYSSLKTSISIQSLLQYGLAVGLSYSLSREEI